jgi:hypothetical protein
VEREQRDQRDRGEGSNPHAANDTRAPGPSPAGLDRDRPGPSFPAPWDGSVG